MAEVKDKIVTVESLDAVHDYAESTYLKKSGALGTLGITATAAELNKLDGITATTAELNYCDGVTSNIQTQLNGKAATHNHPYLSTSGGTIANNLIVKGEIRMGTNGDGKGVICGLAPDGTTYVPNLQPCNENGNCTVGFGNFERGSGITNVYGENVNVYSLNTDGTDPNGSIFTARNANNHTLINYAASLDGAKTSDTYIYGTAVGVRTTNDDFVVDNIQLAHVDEATCTLASDWSIYTSGDSVWVNRYGKVVTLIGALKNTSATTINATKVKMFTIPSGYRPKHFVTVLCQGSGQNKWTLTIGADGVAYAQRYGIDTYPEIPAGAWFPFHCTYIIP